MHGIESMWVEAVAVWEGFRGEVVGDGLLRAFALDGHPKAPRCLAWKHVATGTKRRFVAVLGVGSINSLAIAARASVVQEGREPTGLRPS